MDNFIETSALGEDDGTMMSQDDPSPTGVVGAENCRSFASPEKLLSSSRHRISMITLSGGKSRMIKGVDSERSISIEGESQSRLHNMIEHIQALPLEEWEELETEDEYEYEETTVVEDDNDEIGECSSGTSQSKMEQSNAAYTYASMPHGKPVEEELEEALELHLGAPSPVNSILTEPGGITPSSTGEFTFETVSEGEGNTVDHDDEGASRSSASMPNGPVQNGSSPSTMDQQIVVPRPQVQSKPLEWEYLMEETPMEGEGPGFLVPDQHHSIRLAKNKKHFPLSDVSTNPVWNRRLGNYSLLKRQMIQPSVTATSTPF